MVNSLLFKNVMMLATLGVFIECENRSDFFEWVHLPYLVSNLASGWFYSCFGLASFTLNVW
jgi:hypothetical protein